MDERSDADETVEEEACDAKLAECIGELVGAEARGATLMHLPTSTVGKIKKLHREGEYVSPANDTRVNAFVVEFESGDSFVVDPRDPFVELSPRDLQLYEATNGLIRAALISLMQTAAKEGIEMESAMRIVASAFRAQAIRLAPAA